MLDVIALQALYGASIPISKKLLHYAPPFFLAGFRLFLAGALLLFYSCLYQKKRTAFAWKDVLLYVQIIFFGVYAKYTLRNWSLQYLSASKMAFLFNITPFIAALISYVVSGQTITRKQLIGVSVGFLSVIPIILTTTPIEQLMGELFFISLPEVVLLGAIGAHCYSMIITRTLIKEHRQPVILINGIRMIGGGLLCLVTSYMTESACVITNTAGFVCGVLTLLIISNIICHNWYLSLLKRHSVTFLACMDYLNPLFTALYGWLFLHELITWHYIVSAACIVAGLYVFYQDESKPVRVTAELIG